MQVVPTLYNLHPGAFRSSCHDFERHGKAGAEYNNSNQCGPVYNAIVGIIVVGGCIQTSRKHPIGNYFS